MAVARDAMAENMRLQAEEGRNDADELLRAILTAYLNTAR